MWDTEGRDGPPPPRGLPSQSQLYTAACGGPRTLGDEWAKPPRPAPHAPPSGYRDSTPLLSSRFAQSKLSVGLYVSEGHGTVAKAVADCCHCFPCSLNCAVLNTLRLRRVNSESTDHIFHRTLQRCMAHMVSHLLPRCGDALELIAQTNSGGTGLSLHEERAWESAALNAVTPSSTACTYLSSSSATSIPYPMRMIVDTNTPSMIDTGV